MAHALRPNPPATPPPRHLQLLATLAVPAGVVFGLLTLAFLVGTIRSVSWPVTLPVVVSVVLGAWATLLGAVVTYRLGFEGPRLSRAWEDALAERTRVLRRSVGPDVP
jgi:hypothetical protein